MAGRVQTTPFGVQDSTGVRAVAKLVTPNQRVCATTGKLGTVFDLLAFPGPSITGSWVLPDARTRINGIPTISATAFGITTTIPGPPGTMFVVQADPRVRSF